VPKPTAVPRAMGMSMAEAGLVKIMCGMVRGGREVVIVLCLLSVVGRDDGRIVFFFLFERGNEKIGSSRMGWILLSIRTER
jgi:hypothetical protein